MPTLGNLLGNQPIPHGTIRVGLSKESYQFVAPLYSNGKADAYWFHLLPRADRIYDGKDWRTIGDGTE